MTGDQLLALLQLSGDFMYVVAADGMVQFLHSNQEEFAMPQPSTDIGNRQDELFSPASAQRRLDEIRHVMATGETLTALEELSNGTLIEYRVAPVRDSAGRITSALGVGRDVTEIRRTETRRDHAEQRYRELFERAVEGILQTTPDGRPLVANPAMAQMLGYASVDELLSSVTDASRGVWVDPADRQRFLQRIQREGSVRGFEGRFRRKDGGEIWVSLYSRVFHDPGEPEPRLEGFIEDITERKRADGALAESEAKYRSLFESSCDAALLTAPDGTIFAANAEACRIFGRTEAEICRLGRQGLIDPSDGRLPLLLEERGRTGKVRGELTFIRSGGARFPGEISSAVFPDRHGNTRTSMVIRDVTARRQAEADKAKLEAELFQAQKMESIGRLAGGVAHDFNNLLTVINGYCGLLLEKLPRQDPSRPYLDEIQNAGDRAAALARQLLALSRKQLVKQGAIDVNRLILDSRSLFERLIGEDVDLLLDLCPGGGFVFADPGQMHQVLMNLVVNARDAMPHGGRLTLRTDATVPAQGASASAAASSQMVLTVADTGCGMNEEVRRHLFEPFFTTKPQGQGTGLGLSMVYAIVTQAGGWIDVESQPEAGTVFRIGLPRLSELPPAVRPPINSLAMGDQAFAACRGTETILVVEDQDDVRKLACSVLRAYGYRVLEAVEGEEALALAAQQGVPVDLVLSDVMMPRLNGRELAERLQRRWPNMAVILMSGYAGQIVDERAMEKEHWHFLPKPFTAGSLATLVRRALGPARVRRKALVVDDDEAVRTLFAAILTRAGFDVIAAGDGQQALDLLLADTFDVMITDLVMPGKEGIETIQAARKSWPELKILAVSGAFGGTALEGAVLLGANAAIKKPVPGDALVAAVRSLVGDPA